MDLTPYRVEYHEEAPIKPGHPIFKLCLVHYQIPVVAATYGKSYNRLHSELLCPSLQEAAKQALEILDAIAKDSRRLTATKIAANAAKKNNGRGVQCVASAIDYFLRGDERSAFLICRHDNDKIRNYPDLQFALYELLPDYYQAAKKTADNFGWEDPKEKARKAANP
jgi:hypothetical protein